MVKKKIYIKNSSFIHTFIEKVNTFKINFVFEVYNAIKVHIIILWIFIFYLILLSSFYLQMWRFTGQPWNQSAFACSHCQQRERKREKPWVPLVKQKTAPNDEFHEKKLKEKWKFSENKCTMIVKAVASRAWKTSSTAGRWLFLALSSYINILKEKSKLALILQCLYAALLSKLVLLKNKKLDDGINYF